MICIQCGCSIDSLYVIYPGNHIRLTDCPQCSHIVDKYVEFDAVLLFIDLLLLKQGAFLHTAVNRLELHLAKFHKWDRSTASGSTLSQRIKILWNNMQNWLMKYDKLNRLQIFIVTFEVYLHWMAAETQMLKYQSVFHVADKLMIREILNSSIWRQYTFFFLQVIIEMLVLHFVFCHLLIKYWKWNATYKIRHDIIHYTITIANSAKIFPILMLIWPYDTLLSTTIIQMLANIYIIEAVHIVTRISYIKITSFLAATLILQYCLIQILLIAMVSGFDTSLTKSYLTWEYKLMLFKMNAKKSLYL